ncbi:MAG: RHS repeat-associated core domain-containing protein, partial [Planctomycetaceae bacterium]|nr:RHS repeat-associated core domain-containing protein [Planctomycetaceae bacterium]
TIFVHDDWQVILTFDSAKNKFYGYFWGTRQDELLCYEDYDNYVDNWTLGDHLNTIRDVIKSDGTVAAHLEYNAFGKLISDIKNDLLLFGYTGKLFDKASDLQWNINRWYDSNAGRWVSEDPIGFDETDTNLNRYVTNTPNNKNDILGLKTQQDMANEVVLEFNRYINTIYRHTSTSTDFKYPDEFGIKSHVARQRLVLARVDSFNDTPPPMMHASFKVIRNNLTGNTKSILKYDATILGTPTSGSSIAHELTHAYQYYNGIVTFANLGKENDERFAFVAEFIYSVSRTRVGDWELSLFKGVDSSGNPVSPSDLPTKWKELWNVIPNDLTIARTIAWDTGSRTATDADYLSIRTAYNLGVFCEKVRNYSLPTIRSHDLNPSCFQCPSSLPAAFK